MKSYSQVEMRDPNSLTPYAKNHKRHGPDDIDKLARQIHAFGFDQPIVVDAHNVIIKGHKRRLAALQLGLKQVPVVRSELAEYEAMAARIGDNHVITNSFDNSMLAFDLGTLERHDIDMQLTGMEPEAITQLIDDMPDNPELNQGGPATESQGDAAAEASALDADVPEAPEVPVTQTGDVWHLGPHRLLCGDCTQPDVLTNLLASAGVGQADAVVTDPPYGVSVVAKNKVGAVFAKSLAKKGSYRPVAGDEVAPDISWLLKAAAKCVIWGGNYFADVLPPTNSWLVWDKRCDTGIVNTFADCELAWSNYGGPARIHRQLWNGMIRQGEHTKRVHPTQKPVAVLSWCLSFIKGDVVFDPYSGSGTTLIACEQSQKRCLACEIDPAYCDVIVDRWQKLTGGQAERHPASA